MYSRHGLVTVGVVARDHLADRPRRGPLPRAFGERQWLALVVLIVGTELITLALNVGPSPERGQHLVAALIWCGPIVLLRRWPLPVLAVTAVATVLIVGWGNTPLPFGIMIGLAMYFAAAWLPRRVSVLAAVTAATGLGAAIIYAALASRATLPAIEAVEAFVPLTAAWFIGDSVAARRRYVAGLAEQAERERTTEAERARSGLDELTERERQVLSLVAQGLSNAELAQTLHVTLPTAKTHVSRILTKLGARDRTLFAVPGLAPLGAIPLLAVAAPAGAPIPYPRPVRAAAPAGGWAIETHDLTKRFGVNVAVDDVELLVPRGCAFGYLGPNGAGKGGGVVPAG